MMIMLAPETMCPPLPVTDSRSHPPPPTHFTPSPRAHIAYSLHLQVTLTHSPRSVVSCYVEHSNILAPFKSGHPWARKNIETPGITNTVFGVQRVSCLLRCPDFSGVLMRGSSIDVCDCFFVLYMQHVTTVEGMDQESLQTPLRKRYIIMILYTSYKTTHIDRKVKCMGHYARRLLHNLHGFYAAVNTTSLLKSYTLAVAGSEARD